MDLRLEGKTAVVTGGSRGIGKAIARQLAREGVDVAIAARDISHLEATASELSSETGRRIIPLTVDTADGDSVSAMAQAAREALGPIGILVNGAAKPMAPGVPLPRFDAVTTEMFLEEINVKVLGYLRCAQAFAPDMIQAGWGRIINISGLAARQVSWVVGSMRNVSVVAMTKNLADELAPHGINVNVVHPGMTVTEATSEELRTCPHTNLLGRMVDASEVADVICFLASPRAVAINGDLVVASGGTPRVIYY